MIDWRVVSIDVAIIVILGVVVACAAIALGARGEDPGLDTIPPPVYQEGRPCATC